MNVAAVLIVKDEAQTIGRCIASARAAGVETFTVVDTGSTDGTPEVLFDLGIKVHVREWVNFGHNRSEAFILARGTADWLLALDADMTVEMDPDFEPDGFVDAYMIEVGDGITYRLPLLLRGDLPWVSIGAVHEYTCLYDGTIGRREPTDKVRITHHGAGRSSLAKSRWHASMLEEELAKDPSNPRTRFYLGRTYQELGEPYLARLHYQARADMGGWEEERWYASYMAAALNDDMLGLLRCWESRPQRLEPLHALISEMNRREMHHAAYRLSAGVSGPCGDILFVDRAVWDWGMAFERSIACWWVGDTEEFARLTSQLLLTPSLPSHVRAQVMANFALRAA